MKNLLLYLVSVLALISCSQSDEPLVDESQMDGVELRSDAEIFAPSNLETLYEYGCVSNGQYVDFYYSSRDLGSSYYDTRTNRTYGKKRILGKLFKNPNPIIYEYDTYKLTLCYHPYTNTYQVLNRDVFNRSDDNFYQYIIIKDLGYIIYSLPFDDPRKRDGSMEYLVIYKKWDKELYRADYARYQDGYSRYQDEYSGIWAAHYGQHGWIVAPN